MAVFSDDVLFIHIPKTGGWSAKNYLKQAVPGVLLPEEHDYPFPIGHIPLRDVERFSGRSPNSFQRIVAIVRNPYEQQLSQWLFWRDRFARGGRHPHDYGAAIWPDITPWLMDTVACDFHVWYEEAVPGATKTTATRNGYRDFGGYYRYWLELPDGTMPDHLAIVRFEEMTEAFPAAVREFADPEVEFPHLNAGPKRAGTRDYFTPLAMQLVERKFAWAFGEGWYEKWER